MPKSTVTPPPVSEPEKQQLRQDFAKAYDQVAHPRFLAMEAIGGEVPFYVFTYPPAGELIARQEIKALAGRMLEKGKPTCTIDLFALCHELLAARVDLDDLAELEAEGDREEFLETLQSLLDLETTLVPAIKDRVADAPNGRPQVVFLHGVGQVFPFLRTHSLLHNLQAHLTDLPTVLFFPGTYTGTSLELFSRLKNDNYYRAFHLNNLNLTQ